MIPGMKIFSLEIVLKSQLQPHDHECYQDRKKIG